LERILLKGPNDCGIGTTLSTYQNCRVCQEHLKLKRSDATLGYVP